MKKHILFSFVFGILSLLSSGIYALPRFALMRGDANCLSCHVNPTGGELRGPGGVSYAINDLPMWKRGDSIKYTGEISPGLRLGGDFRSQVLMFSQTSPLYNTPTDSGAKLTKIGDTTKRITSFHAMSLAFEINVKATNTLSGFFRYDPLGITPTEGWTLLQFVHSTGEIFQSGDVVTNAYVKIGAFLPAFGIRFDDHTTYIRGGNASESTGQAGFQAEGFFWSPGYRDVGAEIGTTLFDHISFQGGVFNGSETAPYANFNPTGNKAICMRLTGTNEFIEDVLDAEIGGSYYLHNHATEGDSPNLSDIAVHLGLRVGPVTILSEYDMGKNINVGGTTMPKVSALCIESTLGVTKGLDFMVRYETFKDENPIGVVNTEVNGRIVIGAQWFPLRFVEIRPEYRIAMTSAQNQTNSSIMDDFTENTMLIQTHVFF